MESYYVGNVFWFRRHTTSATTGIKSRAIPIYKRKCHEVYWALLYKVNEGGGVDI